MSRQIVKISVRGGVLDIESMTDEVDLVVTEHDNKETYRAYRNETGGLNMDLEEYTKGEEPVKW